MGAGVIDSEYLDVGSDVSSTTTQKKYFTVEKGWSYDHKLAFLCSSEKPALPIPHSHQNFDSFVLSLLFEHTKIFGRGSSPSSCYSRWRLRYPHKFTGIKGIVAKLLKEFFNRKCRAGY